MLSLEHAMTYTLEVAGPLEASDGSKANPRRQYWQMSKATLEGPKIKARSAMPGIDWFTPYPDGYIARGRLLGGHSIEYDVYRVG